MYVVSIATLFLLSYLNPSFHTKSTFEKGDFAKFWILMDGTMEFDPCFELLNK
jgi:hypothetical protein